MYSLFVSGSEDTWNGKPWILEESRCLREYTDDDLTEKYGDFNSTQIEALRRFPCIFAYEAGCKKNPKFGILRDAVCRKGKVKIDYELVKVQRFINYTNLEKMKFELDISDWELNRTHWALKNINLAKELASKKINLPRWARSEAKAVDITTNVFDVALSFPGEVRDYVELIAGELEGLIGPNAYFYDNNYKAQLARPSLDTLLQEIYRDRARLIVVFLCEAYQKKDWCGIEFRAIREIIKEKDHQRLMFVRMDQGKVEGVFSTDGYIDGQAHSSKEVARFIQERVSLLA